MVSQHFFQSEGSCCDTERFMCSHKTSQNIQWPESLLTVKIWSIFSVEDCDALTNTSENLYTLYSTMFFGSPTGSLCSCIHYILWPSIQQMVQHFIATIWSQLSVTKPMHPSAMLEHGSAKYRSWHLLQNMCSVSHWCWCIILTFKSKTLL